MLKTMQNRLAESCQKNARNIAVEYGAATLTYETLEGQSNRIANFLAAKEIKPGSFVGIFVKDKIDLIIAMIGILKARCVFVPLDTNYPEKRLESMLSEIDARIILTDELHYLKLQNIIANKDGKEEIVLMGDCLNNGSTHSFVQTGPEYDLEDAIYIYFTSGSTGNPKAVVGINKSLVHFMEWEIETFNIDASFRISQFTSVSFDASLRDIFVPLFCGGTVCIPENREDILETNRLIDWIEQKRINLIHCTPSLFKLFNSRTLTNENFKDLKYVLMAGEKLNPAELVKWYDIFGERIQLVNLYGSTETTLIKTFYFITPEDTKRKSIPIGKPMKGSRIIILDRNMQICNQGVVGEIYVRTPFRTLGYYRNPELNKEKFIVNPFNNDANDLIYKTGDQGRLLPDGNYEFLGRNDRQVKIRGIRIEISEIETILLSHISIKEAVVVDKENAQGELFLCAYIVEEDLAAGDDAQRKLDLQDLKEFLKDKLPEHMIPGYFVKLERLPITANGKLDFKALPEPTEYEMEEYIAPRDEIESKLEKIWREILGLAKVGINKSFLETGGHSLNAMTLVAKVLQEFDVELSLDQIFRNGTIEGIASFIKEAREETSQDIIYSKKNVYTTIPPAEKKEYYQLSSSQKRLFILEQIGNIKTTYNMPSAAFVKGDFPKERIEKILNELINRHEALRTSFILIDGEPVQRIHENVDFAVSYMEMKEQSLKDDDPNALNRLVAKLVEEFVNPFELDKAPLFRAKLVKFAENDYVFIFDMHHIITDGESMNILNEEFIKLYKGEKLPEIKVQYKDFSEWQNKLLESEILKAEEEYWFKQFSGEIPILHMPTDYPRPIYRSFSGERIYFQLKPELVPELRHFLVQKEITLSMFLLSIYFVVLFKYTGQEDIMIGLPIAGRVNEDLRNVVGFFLNTLVIRSHPRGNLSFRELLEEVRLNSLMAYQNQEYPFDKLVEKLNIKTEGNRNPLFDVMFIMQNITPPSSDLPVDTVDSKPINMDLNYAKFDFKLEAFENSDQLLFALDYCKDLYLQATMERLTKRFLSIIEEVLENPEIHLSKIESREKAGLISDYISNIE